MNVIFQSFFNLIFPAALAFGIGYLLVWKLSFPQWIYVPLIIVGVFLGLFSMVKFLIYTLKTFEKIEDLNKKDNEISEELASSIIVK